MRLSAEEKIRMAEELEQLAASDPDNARTPERRRIAQALRSLAGSQSKPMTKRQEEIIQNAERLRLMAERTECEWQKARLLRSAQRLENRLPPSCRGARGRSID